MARRAKTAIAGGAYEPNPNTRMVRPKRLKLEKPTKKRRFTQRDGMADYVENGEWWIARSSSSLRSIQLAFDRGDVGAVLYERTGAIIEIGHSGTHYILGIQLVLSRHNWDLDTCLEEVDIILEEKWDGVSQVDPTQYILK